MINMKNFSIYLAAIVFFIAGFFVANLHRNYIEQTLADFQQKEEKILLADNSQEQEWVEVSPNPSPIVWQETNNQPNNQPGILNQPTGKFIIKEISKITPAKTAAETGEDIYFSTAIKNVGSKKKFLTHICFQYNGGNFGCVLNKNLFPEEEFAFGNSMTFTKPGNYSVWITFSQDGTNFYRPLSASAVTVNIQ